jgi:hypothetical protein
MEKKGIFSLEQNYNSTLTGAGFLHFELKQICRLLNEKKYTEKEIKKIVIEEKLFRYNKLSSVKRVLSYLLKRSLSLGEQLRALLLSTDYREAILINLASIIKTDKLFREFVYEIIAIKYKSRQLTLEKREINSFFDYKSEQSTKVDSFSPTTLNKLRVNYQKILIDSGILNEQKKEELKMIYLSNTLQSAFEKNRFEFMIKIFEEVR